MVFMSRFADDPIGFPIREYLTVNIRFACCVLVTACLFSISSIPTYGQVEQEQAQPETFETIFAEYNEAMQAAQKAAGENAKKLMDDFQAKLDAAETDQEKKAITEGGMPAMPMFNPMGQSFVAEFSRRFLNYAANNPTSDDAVKALENAILNSNGPDGEARTWKAAINTLQEHFVESEAIGNLVRTLGQYHDPAAVAALQSVSEKNPSRLMQGMALKSLIGSHTQAVESAEKIQRNKRSRKIAEENQGAEAVEAMLAGLPDLKTALEKFQSRLRTDYSDIFPDLSVGQPAPDSISKNLDGTPARLSDYKGRVVVLDFWATWCGPCRAMIPHETEMVEHFANKPFSLVSISVDADLETLTDFLAETEMDWNHWWAGDDQALTQKWDIQYFPTIYVIDAKGIIRFKDLREDKLQAAVEELLAEMETKDH